ncbi:MAG TPA: AraC family transcriptional regulator [Polyangiaceae bacterium]|nr:AraC family transcriptional regulator [Polyangiaceae bacterium]
MERTRFCHRVELPGVELLEVVDSQRPWRRVCSTFELMVPDSWRGQIAYRGARYLVDHDMLFCPGPGDSFEISRAALPGSFRVLMIERETFCRALSKHGLSPESLAFNRIISPVPNELAVKLVQLLDDLSSGCEASSIESSMEALTGAIATHLRSPGAALSSAPSAPSASSALVPSSAPSASVAQRVRKLIHSNQEKTLDLAALSREIGLSRFQVLRAFKRAYGLPPQAYQLCARIAQAQRLLRLGHRPAYVAAQLRFVDQSHFTRHFKRLLRVTPSEYARAVRGPAKRRKIPAHASRRSAQADALGSRL